MYHPDKTIGATNADEMTELYIEVGHARCSFICSFVRSKQKKEKQKNRGKKEKNEKKRTEKKDNNNTLKFRW